MGMEYQNMQNDCTGKSRDWLRDVSVTTEQDPERPDFISDRPSLYRPDSWRDLYVQAIQHYEPLEWAERRERRRIRPNKVLAYI